LDVNGNGAEDFRDVVYMYRKVALGRTAAGNNGVPGPLNLRPSASYQLGTNVTIEQVEANIVSLLP